MIEAEIIEEIKRCTDRLIENQTEECRWNDRMLEPTDQHGFAEIVRGRSEAIRAFYTENEECIRILRGYLECPITTVTADALYESARSMLLQGRMDPGLICEVATPVVKYLQGKEEEEERAIILATIRNACMLDYYNRMLGDYHISELVDSLQWVISHKEKYSTYEDIRVRSNIFHGYSHLIMLYVQIGKEEYLPRVMQLLDEVNELWNRAEIQQKDGKNPALAFVENEFLFSLPLEVIMGFPGETEENEVLFRKINGYLEKSALAGENDVFMKELLESYQKQRRKELTDESVVEIIFDLAGRLPKPEWESDLAQSQRVLECFGYLNMVGMRMINQTSMTPEQKEHCALRLQKSTESVLNGLPYQYLTAYVSSLLKGVLGESLPNVFSVAVAERMVYHLLVRRQPSTYLHSHMVEEISVLIAEEMLKKRPELFVSLPGYECTEDVLADREELLQEIARGARLHDLGKCYITPVIMMQSRKITDDEFMCIKQHPQLGMEILKDKPEFQKYYDIIRGHHKTYDGKGGYPTSFDNTVSPYRILIDLISISDSTDAATDITGRNYTVGKDFNKLLGELIAGAGTRYNSEIVKLIAESPELIKRLTHLTGEKRISHCYRAYQEMVYQQSGISDRLEL